MKLLKLLMIIIFSCTQIESMNNAPENPPHRKRPRNECAYFYACQLRKIEEKENQQRTADRAQLLSQNPLIIARAAPDILIPRYSFPETRKNSKG